MKKAMTRHKVIQSADASIRLIPLTQGQNAIVDAADYDWLNQWNWYAQWQPRTKSFYAQRREQVRDGGKMIHMGRLILGLPRSVGGKVGKPRSFEGYREVDHKNGNTLDYRRENLRPATSAENNRNRKPRTGSASGFKGVVRDHRRWRAKIFVPATSRAPARAIYLGSFATPEQAARAYDSVARLAYGEFARLNFPS